MGRGVTASFTLAKCTALCSNYFWPGRGGGGGVVRRAIAVPSTVMTMPRLPPHAPLAQLAEQLALNPAGVAYCLGDSETCNHGCYHGYGKRYDPASVTHWGGVLSFTVPKQSQLETCRIQSSASNILKEKPMPRNWVIAPVESKPPGLFDKVWQFDLAHNLISIGWSQLGDVSNLSREELLDSVAAAYPDKPATTVALFRNMLWSFFHEIAAGDFVIARRGRKTLAAVGKVTGTAFYAPGKNPFLASDYSHHNFLSIEWQEQPRDKTFSTLVFPMQTLAEFSEDQYRNVVHGTGPPPVPPEISEPIEDQNEFVLEKYLEDFIVSNFDTIFKGRLKIYEDAEGNEAQQYPVDKGWIDILAVEPESNAFVVIELKKGRTSDQVVGQILRYMGWVKKNLCKDGQPVKGLIICRQPETKLSDAIEMTTNIDVRYYSVSFTLRK